MADTTHRITPKTKVLVKNCRKKEISFSRSYHLDQIYKI